MEFEMAEEQTTMEHNDAEMMETEEATAPPEQNNELKELLAMMRRLINECKPSQALQAVMENPAAGRINKEIIQIAFDSMHPSEGHCIFKVPIRLRLRKDEDRIYVPEVICIGPYNHSLRPSAHAGGKNPDYETMETHKKRYLHLLLGRRGGGHRLEEYIQKLKSLEKRARAYYADPIDYMNENQFAEMMLLDGIFIVELLRKFKFEGLRAEDNCLLSQSIQDSLVRDLLLLENQLPFFVLQELFNMTLMEVEQSDHFYPMVLEFLSKFVMKGFNGNSDHISLHSQVGIKHLLDLLHKCWRPSIPFEESSKKDGKENLDPIPCATKLHTAGIKFKRLENSKCLFDIKFEKGILLIPRVEADLDTKKILRNLVAYEHCRLDHIDMTHHVSSYAFFMDSLIDTGKDVESLSSGTSIINNWYSTDKEAATLFNELGYKVMMANNYFYYSDTSDRVLKHYNGKWRQWCATLKQKYFYNPWAIVSVIVASFVIGVAITQTVFTVLPYYLR